MNGVKKFTDGGGEIFEWVGGEAEKETTLSNAGISNHQQLEQVVEFPLIRRRFHLLNPNPKIHKNILTLSSRKKILMERRWVLEKMIHEMWSLHD